MKKNTSILITVVYFLIAVAFVFLFPLINEMIVGDQVETHTATVVNCDQKYRLTLFGGGSGNHVYDYTVTATLEDGTEITAKETHSYQQSKFYSGEKITVYGLKNKYKLDREDLFAPWSGNTEVFYITLLVIGGALVLVGGRFGKD